MICPEQGRRERKFVLTSETANAISEFVCAYLQPDEHMKSAGREGYRVSTLYLDTPDFELYRRSVDGKKNRYKLRIRFYDAAADGVVFLEMKNRKAKSIIKRRAAVTREAAEKALAGESISPDDLIDGDEKSALAASEFCEHRDLVNAQGVVLVSYLRQAYDSHLGDRTRVTFDHQVVAQPYDPDHRLCLVDDATSVSGSAVIMELKHSGGMPAWMRDLVKTFSLTRVSYPKYVYSANAIGARFSPSEGQENNGAGRLTRGVV